MTKAAQRSITMFYFQKHKSKCVTIFKCDKTEMNYNMLTTILFTSILMLKSFTASTIQSHLLIPKDVVQLYEIQF